MFKCYQEYKEHLDLTDSKVLGLMKDETPGRVITEVVALRPKTYCYDKVKVNTNDVKTDRRAKGLPQKCARSMFMDIYKETLFCNDFKRDSVNFNCIRSKNSNIYSTNHTKLGISNNDDKRWWQSNLVSLPYGHFRN